MREGGEVGAAASSGIAGRGGSAQNRAMAAGMWIAVAAALLGAAPAVPPVMTGEIVLPRAEEGFVLHQTGYQFGSYLYEYRLRGENAARWTRMIVLSRAPYPPGAGDLMMAKGEITARATAATVGGALQFSCPRASIKVERAAPIVGRQTATLRAACPDEATTHDPVTTHIRAITGQSATHTVAALIRGDATRADVKWADRVIANLTICDPGDVAGRCAARSRVVGDAL